MAPTRVQGWLCSAVQSREAADQDSHTASTPTRDPAEFAARAVALLERTDAARRPVRLVGVGSHGLVGVNAGAPAGEAPDEDPASASPLGELDLA